MPNPNMFGPASMILSQGISSFTTFLPPLAEVRKASADEPGTAGDVRLGEVAAATLTIGLGAIASSVVGDPLPTYISIVVSIALICIYESALRADRPFEPKIIDLGEVARGQAA